MDLKRPLEKSLSLIKEAIILLSTHEKETLKINDLLYMLTLTIFNFLIRLIHGFECEDP